jgi:hypothetical protein
LSLNRTIMEDHVNFLVDISLGALWPFMSNLHTQAILVGE